MFDTKNNTGFQAVTHFLLTTCGRAFEADRFLARMKPCFPSLDKNQEVDFRKVVVEFFNTIEKVTFGTFRSLFGIFFDHLLLTLDSLLGQRFRV